MFKFSTHETQHFLAHSLKRLMTPFEGKGIYLMTIGEENVAILTCIQKFRNLKNYILIGTIYLEPQTVKSLSPFGRYTRIETPEMNMVFLVLHQSCPYVWEMCVHPEVLNMAQD